MAADQVTTLTEKYYLKDLVDNIFKTNALLSKLKEGIREYDGGNSIVVPLEYAVAASGSSFTGLGLLDTAIGDIATQAQFEWRQYYVTLGWSRLDYLKNRSSKARIVDLVEAVTNNASKTMQENLTTGLFQATKAKGTDIDGLAVAALAVNTTAYGGLSSTDFTSWQPGGAAAGRDTSTTTVSLSAMNVIYRLASDGNDHVNLIVTSDTIFGFIYNLLTPNQQFVNTTDLKTGFTTLTWNGVPIITDKVSTGEYIYFLNTKHIWLAAHEEENMRYEKPKQPANQAASIGQVFWMGNIVGDSRRRLGAMTNVDS